MKSKTILKGVKAVTAKWTKQRKAEERGRSRVTRYDALVRSRRVTTKDAAAEVMEAAYLKASANGRYPASARQIMYAARPHILKITGRQQLDSQYFSQTILPEYMAASWNRDKVANWDVTYDSRGHLTEPHTKMIVSLGTLDVRRYLRRVCTHEITDSLNGELCISQKEVFPTVGPEQRFSALVFIEKEGFMPLFEAAKLSERYDVAIMSTKGMPVVACRWLADEMCGSHNIPLLVLRDFDKAGFSIAGTLKDVDHWDRNFNEVVKRYEFQHDIQVIDLGLRLADIKKYDLPSEEVAYRSDPSENLRQNGATNEEIEFLCRGSSWHIHSGHRVELNAFTSGDFIAWIEEKLELHGIKKIVPERDVLRKAYRRASQIAEVNQVIINAMEIAVKNTEKMRLPRGLEKRIRKAIEDDPARSWDQIVAEIAAENCQERGGKKSRQAS